jgi:DNA-binding NtrC family response regulator
MQTTLVLAVGLDSSQFENRYSVLRASKCFVTSVGSIQEAISHFHHGDFDLVLIGNSLSAESRERLAFLIRSLSSRIPVVYVTESPGDGESFADAIIHQPDELQQCIETLLPNGRTIATSFLG